jgi:glycosidase
MIRKITIPDWVAGKTIYEVNLRQYTKEGTFKAFEKHLPRLKDFGVGILWFMPLQPIGKKTRKGTLGSYYSVSDYTAINPEFGSLEEFKTLVGKIHEMGMKVIIDWVANHTAWDHVWTKEHPEFYSKDEKGGFRAPVPEWEDVIHLDYGNPDLWDTMIADMVFWLKETDVDGFRCDMAHLVPTLFWNRARRDLDRIKPVYMLAESENFDLLEYAFDSLYNWKMLHAMNDLSSGKISADQLAELIVKESGYLPKGATLLNFLSNHDENSWQGSAIERIHYFLEPLTVLTFLLPGIPLIYSGQEAGNHRRIKFFDKDEINWKEDKMSGLYNRLVDLNSKIPEKSIHGTVHRIENDSERSIFSLEVKDGSKRIVFFLNLSSDLQTFHIQCEDYSGAWTDLQSGELSTIDCSKKHTLEPYKFQVYFK